MRNSRPCGGSRKGKPDRRSSPRGVATTRQRGVALGMRRQGCTFTQIGEHLGVTRQRACQVVQAALRAAVREPARELLTLELARLDELLTMCFESAIQGDRRAIERVLRISDQRMRLVLPRHSRPS
jgi:hypothetical protein